MADRLLLVFPLLLVVIAGDEMKVDTPEPTEKCYRIVQEVDALIKSTEATTAMSREEFEQLRGEKQAKALELLQSCLDLEEEEEKKYHVDALYRMAATFESKKRPALAIGAMERALELDSTPAPVLRLAKLYDRLGDRPKARQLLVDVLLSHVVDPSLREQGWEAVRTTLANLPLSANFTEHLSPDPYHGMVLQELSTYERIDHNVKALQETLVLCIQNSPFNKSLRRALLVLSGQLGDVLNLWRAQTLPFGVNYDNDTALVSVFNYAAHLPTAAMYTARSLLDYGDTNKTWIQGMQGLLRVICGEEVAVDDVRGVGLLDSRGLIVRCLEKHGVAHLIDSVAKSVEPPVKVFTTPLEGGSATVAHVLAALHPEALRVLQAPEEAYKVQGPHGITPAHILAATFGVLHEGSEDVVDKWGRKPKDLTPCWASAGCTADTSALEGALKKDVKDPKKEWSRVGVKEEKGHKWTSWQEREDFPSWMEERVGNTPRCQIDYRKVTKEGEVVEKYLTAGRPVMIRDAIEKDHKVRKEQNAIFSFAGLANALGNVAIPVSMVHHIDPVPAIREHSKPAQASILAFAVNELRHYNRSTLLGPMRGPFKKVAAKPEALQRILSDKTLDDASFHLYIGGAGGGRPMTFSDGHTFSYLAHGRRTWILVPPSDAHYSPLTPYEIFERYLTGDVKHTYYECPQLKGDALYIPPGWSAAALNVRESIGYEGVFGWLASLPFHEEPLPLERTKPKKPEGGARGSVTLGSREQDEDED